MIYGVVLAVAVAGLVVGAFVLQRWKPFENSGDDHPTAWPESVQPLAEFVEGVTSLTFEHPISVKFYDRNDYDDELRVILGRTPPPDNATRQRNQDTDSIGRALGLLTNKQSFTVDRTPAAFGPVFFDRPNDVILVSADEDDIAVEARVQLVGALTQVIQLQQWQGAQDVAEITSLQEQNTMFGLLSGQSVWATERYFDTLSPEDRDELASVTKADFSVYYVPAVRAFNVGPAQLGATLVEALRQTDRRLVADAVNHDRPTALDQLSLPATKYLHRDRTEHVDPPPVPRDGTLVRSGEFGYLTIYLTLSLGSPENVALTAADGWGGDAYTAYLLDDRMCVDLHVVADSRSDADRLDDAISGWAAARLAKVDAKVGRDGTSIYVTMCDPGTESTQPGVGRDALDEIFGRAFQIRDETRRYLHPDVAECVWVAIYAERSQDDFDNSFPEDIQQEAAERRATCADEL